MSPRRKLGNKHGLNATINNGLKSQNAVRKGKHPQSQVIVTSQVTLSLEESKQSKGIPQIQAERFIIQYEAWL